jgi:hypothetical protein
MDQSTLHDRRQQDHAALQNLLTTLNGAKNALRRDACGDWMIAGLRGQIRTCDGRFTVYIACHSKQAWTFAKRKLEGFTFLAYDGDEEGVLYLTRIPLGAEIATLRNYIGLRQTRDATAHAFKKQF